MALANSRAIPGAVPGRILLPGKWPKAAARSVSRNRSLAAARATPPGALREIGRAEAELQGIDSCAKSQTGEPDRRACDGAEAEPGATWSPVGGVATGPIRPPVGARTRRSVRAAGRAGRAGGDISCCFPCGCELDRKSGSGPICQVMRDEERIVNVHSIPRRATVLGELAKDHPPVRPARCADGAARRAGAIRRPDRRVAG